MKKKILIPRFSPKKANNIKTGLESVWLAWSLSDWFRVCLTGLGAYG